MPLQRCCSTLRRRPGPCWSPTRPSTRVHASFPIPPCTLERAVEVEPQAGDEVIVNSGTYNLGTNFLNVAINALNVHGIAGQACP